MFKFFEFFKGAQCKLVNIFEPTNTNGMSATECTNALRGMNVAPDKLPRFDPDVIYSQHTFIDLAMPTIASLEDFKRTGWDIDLEEEKLQELFELAKKEFPRADLARLDEAGWQDTGSQAERARIFGAAWRVEEKEAADSTSATGTFLRRAISAIVARPKTQTGKASKEAKKAEKAAKVLTYPFAFGRLLPDIGARVLQAQAKKDKEAAKKGKCKGRFGMERNVNAQP